MKHITAILLGLSLAPIGAGEANAWFWSDEEPQEAAPAPAAPKSEIDQGTDLLQQGADLLLQGLRKEMTPAMEDMRDSLGQAMDEMGPALKELGAMVGDMKNFEAPEQLPNGDIIIRRKADAPPFVAKPKDAPKQKDGDVPSGTIVAPEGAVDL
jgi:hypothetical protein